MDVSTQIFRFSKDLCDWHGTDEKLAKKHLGGKGAALVKMSQAGMPVPPGLTITTDVCNHIAQLAKTYGDNSNQVDALIETLMDELQPHMKWLSATFGFMPLVSVRSGAPISMPGMMDTILNVGLIASDLSVWEGRLGKRAAWDSYRRLIQMLGHTAYGVPSEKFEEVLQFARNKAQVETDAELTVDNLQAIAGAFEEIFEGHTGHPFPQKPWEQLEAAIRAVFKSWMNPRAIEYRKLNKIDEAMGTAVNVQAMVFGNMGDTSGSGVLFTRNPSTGENVIMGEYLVNAQGEDVVAGIRTPDPLSKWIADADLGIAAAPWAQELIDLCDKLEDSYRDMVDVEFTVQQNQLFLLQSRAGKRSAQAAFKIAVDLVDEGLITATTAISRITPEQFRVVKRPIIDPAFKTLHDRLGLPACPGVVVGRPVFSAEEAVAAKDPVILVTHETTPDDIAGMAAAIGILTQTGGATSHAAVVARAMDKTCITGCTTLDLGNADLWKNIKTVTLDGSTGRVWFNTTVPVIDGSASTEVERVTEWCWLQSTSYLSTPVRDEAHVLKGQVVRAAEWWGDEQVADAVLADMAEDAALETLILDIRPPVMFLPNDDLELLGCFNGDNGTAWGAMLVQMLIDRADSLKGLTLRVPDGFGPVLSDAGYVYLKDVTAAPLDYIVFKQLAA